VEGSSEFDRWLKELGPDVFGKYKM